MDKEELKEYLKENLSITIETEKEYGYYSDDPTYITIKTKLILEGEVISESETMERM